MKNILILFLLSFSLGAFAQSPIGIWKNIDDEDGKAKSHIEIYEENGALHGKVIKLLPAATLTHCNKCKDDRKGKSIEGMIIMNDLVADGDEWDGGEIIDPKSGKVYSCLIKMNGADKLDVRGYMGVPLIGRTQTWFRVNPK